MKIKTHIKLAELAFNNINVVPKGFSKLMFDFGIMAADQSWHVITHPHYMKKSLGYVIEKVEKLFAIKNFNAYFSMQLGIVVHYLCDFCCNSHISGTVGNISYHLKYERGLQRYLFKNYDVLDYDLNHDQNNIRSTIENVDSFKSFIRDILYSYVKGEPSYLWDIIQCVKITSIVISAIFSLKLDSSAINSRYITKKLQIRYQYCTIKKLRSNLKMES